MYVAINRIYILPLYSAFAVGCSEYFDFDANLPYYTIHFLL